MIKLHTASGMPLKMWSFLDGNATDVRVLTKAKEAIEELLAKV